MELLHMEALPKRAGVATLNISPRVTRPSRREAVINIPLRRGVAFFPLRRGEQFLLRIRENHFGSCRYCGQPIPAGQTAVCFGGTDQRTPFLVDLVPKALEPFRKGGEEAFFDALKPWVIRALEEKYGAENTRRQGDIFAYSLPWSWEELGRRHLGSESTSLVTRGRRKVTGSFKIERGQGRLFGTRHVFIGDQADVWTTAILDDPEFRGWADIGEGRIEAPDHDPLILEGPHVLTQTALLRFPAHAD